jgi:hypothetical protein
VEVETVEYGDPADHITSTNLRRRHLNENQRAMVAARLSNISHGSNRYVTRAEGEEPPIGGSSISVAAAAAMNVGERSVERAECILCQGTPEEIIKAVEKGSCRRAARPVMEHAVRSLSFGVISPAHMAHPTPA